MLRRFTVLLMLVAVLGGTWLFAAIQSPPVVATAAQPAEQMARAQDTPAPPSGENLTVYAAASLTNAFTEIAALYTLRTGWQVDFNFGASSALRTQIEQGGVADVFASADTRQMDMLVASGLNAWNPEIFVTNRLVVIVPASNPAGITTLRDLGNPGVKFITTQPSVPIGQYTLQVLDNMSADPAFGSDFRARVEANIVSSEENVRGILSKVALGEADAGIVYISDINAAPPDSLLTLEIPDQFNVLAQYPIVGLADAPHLDQAQLFVDLVFSPEGQAILGHYRFSPVLTPRPLGMPLVPTAS